MLLCIWESVIGVGHIAYGKCPLQGPPDAGVPYRPAPARAGPSNHEMMDMIAMALRGIDEAQVM